MIIRAHGRKRAATNLVSCVYPVERRSRGSKSGKIVSLAFRFLYCSLKRTNLVRRFRKKLRRHNSNRQQHTHTTICAVCTYAISALITAQKMVVKTHGESRLLHRLGCVRVHAVLPPLTTARRNSELRLQPGAAFEGSKANVRCRKCTR